MSMITELVKRLKNFANEYAFADTDTMEVLNDAADVIEELSAKLQAANMERSSQYYNGGWIPVSERLPEVGECKMYLITVAHYNPEYMGRFVEVCAYESRELWEGRIPTWERDFSDGARVIAWMPLPEPYKESEV